MTPTKAQVEEWLQSAGLPTPGNVVTRDEVMQALRELPKRQLDAVMLYITDEADGSAQVSIALNSVPSYMENKYFHISSPTTQYYVWYLVDGVGSDPAITGKTGIQVNLDGTELLNEVAEKTAAAIDAEADFTATAPDYGVIISGTNDGQTLHPSIAPGNCDCSTYVISRGGTGAMRRFLGVSSGRNKVVTDINPHTGGTVEMNRAVSLSLIDAGAAIAPQWSADTM